MKKYVKPMMDSEVFVSNEYVSACYYGSCSISGEVYRDTNGNGVYDSGIDKFNHTNTACGEKFEITGATAEFPSANAFVVGKQWHADKLFDLNLGYGIIIPIYNILSLKEIDTVTPVYRFENVHVTKLGDIRQHEKPNHS